MVKASTLFAPSQEAGVKQSPRLRVNVWFVVVALAVLAIWALQVKAAHTRDAVLLHTYDTWEDHDSQSERVIDELIEAKIYNQPRTALNESFPVTLRVTANPALKIVTACRPPQRLEFKTRVLAPTFDVETALDDVVALPDGVRHFSWMLTPHQSGAAMFRVRGIVYCMSPQSVITMRQTVVDQIRSIAVAEPVVLSIENWTSIGSALLTFVASTGVLAFLRDHFRRAKSVASTEP